MTAISRSCSRPSCPSFLAFLVITAFAALGARRTRIPESIFLVLVGLAISFVPGMPRIVLQPNLVFEPAAAAPASIARGVNMSWRGFKGQSAPHPASGGRAGDLHHGRGSPASHITCWDCRWRRAFVLGGGGIAAGRGWAPMAIARRFALPQRVLTILEGEGPGQ